MQKYLLVGKCKKLDYHVIYNEDNELFRQYGIAIFKKDGNEMLSSQVACISRDFDKVSNIAKTFYMQRIDPVHLLDCVENILCD